MSCKFSSSWLTTVIKLHKDSGVLIIFLMSLRIWTASSSPLYVAHENSLDTNSHICQLIASRRTFSRSDLIRYQQSEREAFPTASSLVLSRPAGVSRLPWIVQIHITTYNQRDYETFREVRPHAFRLRLKIILLNYVTYFFLLFFPSLMCFAILHNCPPGLIVTTWESKSHRFLFCIDNYNYPRRERVSINNNQALARWKSSNDITLSRG